MNIGITTYPPETLITGHVRSLYGQDFVVTMEGWYWNALEWIAQNTRLKKQKLVQEVLDRLVESPLDEGLKHYIWQFMDSYDQAMLEHKRGY